MEIQSENRKLFITGATGYIGHYVMKKFIENGWDVTAMVRDDSKRGEIENLGAKVAIGNLADAEFLEMQSEGMDAIIHCAFDVQNWEKSIELDLLAVNSLISAARKNSNIKKCSFIYTSGTFVYGAGDEDKDESSPLDNPLPFVKWRINHENIVLESNKPDTNLNTIVVRPTWVYGGNRGHVDNYLEFTRNDKSVNIVGDGNNFCNFIHVEDLAELYYKLVAESRNGVFNATDNSPTRFIDIVKTLKKNHGLETKLITTDEGMKSFGFGVFLQTINQRIFTKNSIEIGWTPKHKSFLQHLESLSK